MICCTVALLLSHPSLETSWLRLLMDLATPVDTAAANHRQHQHTFMLLVSTGYRIAISTAGASTAASADKLPAKEQQKLTTSYYPLCTGIQTGSSSPATSYHNKPTAAGVCNMSGSCDDWWGL